jgi:hypothetical protein
MATSRRASEDARFRAFLSSHFDAQAYVTNVIKEGRSEECFAEMTSNIIEVIPKPSHYENNAFLRSTRKLRVIYLFTSMS